MRIAVAVDADGRISGHLGRADRFAVYAVAGRNVVFEQDVRVVREGGGGHICGNHEDGHHHEHSANHGHGEHGHGGRNHASILDAVRGCEIVVALGAGPRIIHDLTAAGIGVIGAEPSLTPQQAVQAILDGQIGLGNSPDCGHAAHHHG